MNTDLKDEKELLVEEDEPPNKHFNLFVCGVTRMVACASSYFGLCESRERFVTDVGFRREFCRTYSIAKFY